LVKSVRLVEAGNIYNIEGDSLFERDKKNRSLQENMESNIDLPTHQAVNNAN